MASPFALMSHGVGHVGFDLHHRTAGARAGEAAIAVSAGAVVGGLTSFGLGELYARHRDKWYGRHAPKILAAAGKLLAIAFAAAGWEFAAGVVDTAGQSGVDAIGLHLGIEHGNKATKQAYVAVPLLPDGTLDLTKLPAGSTRIAGLPAAAPGRGLSFDQIQELASMH